MIISLVSVVLITAAFGLMFFLDRKQRGDVFLAILAFAFALGQVLPILPGMCLALSVFGSVHAYKAMSGKAQEPRAKRLFVLGIAEIGLCTMLLIVAMTVMADTAHSIIPDY